MFSRTKAIKHEGAAVVVVASACRDGEGLAMSVDFFLFSDRHDLKCGLALANWNNPVALMRKIFAEVARLVEVSGIKTLIIEGSTAKRNKIYAKAAIKAGWSVEHTQSGILRIKKEG